MPTIRIHSFIASMLLLLSPLAAASGVAVSEVVSLKEDTISLELQVLAAGRDRASGAPRRVDIYLAVDDPTFQIVSATAAVNGTNAAAEHQYTVSEARVMALDHGLHRILRADLPAGSYRLDAQFAGHTFFGGDSRMPQRGQLSSQIHVSDSDIQVVVPIRRTGSRAPAPPSRAADARLPGTRFLLSQHRYYEALLELAEAGAYPMPAQGGHEDQGWLLAEAFIGFNMLDRANLVLRNLDPDARPQTWRRLHVFLADNLVQRQDWMGALRALDATRAQVDLSSDEEWHELRIQALLGLGRFAEVAEHVDGVEQPTPFMRLNRGIALLSAGQTARGEAELETLVSRPLRGLDGNAAVILRDRARLKLANHYLQARRDVEARRILANVGEGRPYSSVARLTRGWAEYAPADVDGRSRAVVNRAVQRALREWEPLLQGALTDLAVQEVMLAIPFAYERLGDDAQAAAHYHKATTALEATLAAMEQSREVIRSGKMVEAILRADADLEGGLSWELNNLPDVEELDWLLGFFAGHGFQEPFKSLRDLRLLQQRSLDQMRELTQGFSTEDRQRLAQLTRSLRTPGARAPQTRFGDGPYAHLIPRVEVMRMRTFDLANRQADHIETLTLAELDRLIQATERRLVESRLALSRIFDRME
jgi:tetratricopeptide (TPR) repeat protein